MTGIKDSLFGSVKKMSTTPSPGAARPGFSIDNILQTPVPLVSLSSPPAMVQLQQQQQQQQQQRALHQASGNQYHLIQLLLNAGSPSCAPYRSIMALSSQQLQQLQQQQQQQQQQQAGFFQILAPTTAISSQPPPPPPSSAQPLACISQHQPRQLHGDPVMSSILSRPVTSIRLSPPSLVHTQRSPSQQGAVTRIATTPIVASIAQEPKYKLVLPECREKRCGPPDLLSIDDNDGSDTTDSPRSRPSSLSSSNNSEEDETERGERQRSTSEGDLSQPCQRGSSPLLSSSTTPSPSAPPPGGAAAGAGSSTHHPSHHHHHRSRELPFKKSRTSFTKAQIQRLEEKFGQQKYLTKLDRTHLAGMIGLTEKHVKTWFQNRRTKWKKECSDADWSHHKEMAATLMYNQYLEEKNKNTQQEFQLDDKSD